MYIITMDKYSSFLFSMTDGRPEFLRGGPLLRGLTCTTKGGDQRTLGLHVEVDSILSYNREDWFFTEQLWPHKHDSIAAMVTCRRHVQNWVCPSKFYPGEGKAHQGILLPCRILEADGWKKACYFLQLSTPAYCLCSGNDLPPCSCVDDKCSLTHKT